MHTYTHIVTHSYNIHTHTYTHNTHRHTHIHILTHTIHIHTHIYTCIYTNFIPSMSENIAEEMTEKVQKLQNRRTGAQSMNGVLRACEQTPRKPDKILETAVSATQGFVLGRCFQV